MTEANSRMARLETDPVLRECAQAPCVLSVRCVEARLRQVPHPLLSRKGEGAGA